MKILCPGSTCMILLGIQEYTYPYVEDEGFSCIKNRQSGCPALTPLPTTHVCMHTPTHSSCKIYLLSWTRWNSSSLSPFPGLVVLVFSKKHLAYVTPFFKVSYLYCSYINYVQIYPHVLMYMRILNIHEYSPCLYVRK